MEPLRHQHADRDDPYAWHAASGRLGAKAKVAGTTCALGAAMVQTRLSASNWRSAFAEQVERNGKARGGKSAPVRVVPVPIVTVELSFPNLASRVRDGGVPCADYSLSSAL